MSCRRLPLSPAISRSFLLFLLPVAGCASRGDSVAARPAAPDRELVGAPKPEDGGASAETGVRVSSGFAPAYSVPVLESVRISSIAAEPHFQNAVASVDFHDGPFERVRLVVDLSSACYPLQNRAAPPAGQRWPADCDAFDRNFDIHLDEPSAMGGTPGIEVLHAITPFGGPLHLDVDITDIANGLPGKHSLTSRINTWSDSTGQVSGSHGGWTISAHIEALPGIPRRNVLAVVSLVDSMIENAAGTVPTLPFTAPPGTTSARLEVRTTGHGGADGSVDPACIGAADEFCQRVHTFLLDGVALDSKTPWRTDCGDVCSLTNFTGGGVSYQYCKENPCGDIGSVQAPRANWCPGTETKPFVWANSTLAMPGKHALKWSIANIANGATWRTSATYFAFGQ